MRIMQWALIVSAAAALLLPTGIAAADQTPLWSGASDLQNIDKLADSMRYRGAAELPLEALAYYELGLQAYRAGDDDQALAYLENAVALDGAFPEAHFAMARITFPRSAFWGSLRDGLRASLNSFGAQHVFMVNVVVGILGTAVLGSFVVLIFAGAQLVPRVQHVIAELLTRWFPRVVAAVASILILAAPFVWGVGLLPAWLLLGGVLWPWMRRAQRTWTLALVGLTALVPAVLWALSPLLFHPLNPEGNPFLLSRAMSNADNPALIAGLNRAIEAEPENPNLYFAHALLDKRAGRLGKAEANFTKALELGGPDAAIRNNLGVLAFLRGDYDGAVSYFRQAVEADRKLAAPHFNLSQAFAKKLYFDKADEELREANRLAFSRIRSIIKHQRGGRNNTLLDELLPASAFWREAVRGPRYVAEIPPGLSILFPGRLGWMPVLCIPLFAVGYLAGRRMHRYLASFECTNCKRPVCRRCLRRIHRRPYCHTCGDALLQVQSVAYSKLVLDSRLKHTGRIHAAVHNTLNWLLPGYHAMRIGQVHLGAALSVAFAVGIVGLVSGHLPVDRMVWVGQEPGLWWPALPIALLVVVQLISWITVVKLEEAEVDMTTPEEDDDAGLAPLLSDRAA